jgi:hypothetical protein
MSRKLRRPRYAVAGVAVPPVLDLKYTAQWNEVLVCIVTLDRPVKGKPQVVELTSSVEITGAGESPFLTKIGKDWKDAQKREVTNGRRYARFELALNPKGKPDPEKITFTARTGGTTKGEAKWRSEDEESREMAIKRSV